MKDKIDLIGEEKPLKKYPKQTKEGENEYAETESDSVCEWGLLGGGDRGSKSCSCSSALTG